MNLEPLESQIEAAYVDACKLPHGGELSIWLIESVAIEGDEMVRRWKLLREFRPGARRVGETWGRATELTALRTAVFDTLNRMRPG